jgi:primosomal protein N' (replication factor Y)
MPTECPDCHNPELKDRGFGTEKIEDIIRDEFPEARIGRMDLDTTRTRNAYERIISDFSSQKTNLLIGTQMVTKGLDFDHVSVVGILSADSMLNFPDFRAWETAYMMITQVAGRAGRKGKQGKVILQTNNPELPIIKQIVNNDFSGYFRDLIQERRAFCYPPFTRLIYIYLKHRDNQIVNNAGIELANRLRQAPALKGKQGTMILGPDKPAVARIKTLCIRKIVLKLDLSLPLAAVRDNIKFCVQQMMTDANYKSLLVHYDVDPG